MPAYVPRRGDVGFADFSPQSGVEQRGERPALVLSPRAFNAKTGLAFVCPVTSRVRGHAFEVPLPPDARIHGVVLSDQLRSIDWRARRLRFHSRIDEHVLDEVLARIEAVLFDR